MVTSGISQADGLDESATCRLIANNHINGAGRHLQTQRADHIIQPHRVEIHVAVGREVPREVDNWRWDFWMATGGISKATVIAVMTI